jgi:hypothetical protein
MITAIVSAPLPEGLTFDQYTENTMKIVERFRTIPGLIRKNFLYSAEEGMGGGVYLWESREAAEACYAGVWLDNFKNAFGVNPKITYFETPAVVDNAAEEIKTVA